MEIEVRGVLAFQPIGGNVHHGGDPPERQTGGSPLRGLHPF